MKLRVSFTVPHGTPAGNVRSIVEGQVIEAAGYRLEDGALELHDKDHKAIICYAAGTWRTIADVGALEQAVAATAPQQQVEPRENSRRREKARPTPTTRLLHQAD